MKVEVAKLTSGEGTSTQAREETQALKVELDTLKQTVHEAAEGKPAAGRRTGTPSKRMLEKKAPAESDGSEDEQEDPKELEMVFAGFKFNTPFKEVKEDIEVILKTPQPAIEYKAIRTTRKMTSFGIVKFATKQEKVRFKKWLGSLKEPLKKNGKKLRVGDNEEKEERTKGRAIAKVARALYENKKGRQDITTDYFNHEVYVNIGDRQKLVACFVGETLKLKGEALELKEKIQQLVDEKRQAEDSASE